MKNISDSLFKEKRPLIHVEYSQNHVRFSERNFFCSLNKKRRLIESPTKQKIKEFSLRSQRNCKFMFDSASVGMTSAITLTYPIETKDLFDGLDIKRHFKAFILAYRRRYGLSIRFVWVLEFQKNGNPHFHLLTDVKAPIEIQRKFVASTWFRVVRTGLKKHLIAGTSCDVVRNQAGCAAYMASYLGKYEQKQVPCRFENVGRFWGGSRNAFNITTSIDFYEDSFEGKDSARRNLRLIKKCKSSKLRFISKQTGKKYNLPKSSGGFVFWSGKNAVKQILEWQSSNVNKCGELVG